MLGVDHRELIRPECGAAKRKPTEDELEHIRRTASFVETMLEHIATRLIRGNFLQ